MKLNHKSPDHHSVHLSLDMRYHIMIAILLTHVKTRNLNPLAMLSALKALSTEVLLNLLQQLSQLFIEAFTTSPKFQASSLERSRLDFFPSPPMLLVLTSCLFCVLAVTSLHLHWLLTIPKSCRSSFACYTATNKYDASDVLSLRCQSSLILSVFER